MVGRTNSTLNGSGFVPDGGTVTPIDDVSVWLKCAGIKDKKYNTHSNFSYPVSHFTEY